MHPERDRERVPLVAGQEARLEPDEYRSVRDAPRSGDRWDVAAVVTDGELPAPEWFAEPRERSTRFPGI